MKSLIDGEGELSIEGLEVYIIALKDERESLDHRIKNYEDALRIRRELHDE